MARGRVTPRASCVTFGHKGQKGHHAMITNMPTIGARFDIEKAGGGYYGFTCWKIVWQAINPEDIGVASLYEGDTAATLNDREKVFCIAVQSLDSGAIAKIKSALSQSEAFKRVCASPMFVEGSSCAAEPLPDAGRIDAEGNLVGDAGASRSALGAVRKERTTATEAAAEVPIPERVKPASERTRTLPAISSFKELGSFIDKQFGTKEYQGQYGAHTACWMTPEELCDVVERHADMILVSLDEYSCPASEDMCLVRLFEKTPPGKRPIGFTGLYPFASVSDAHSFGQDWRSVPDYARDLPRLADVRGKYHFNFTRGGSAENSLDEPFDPKEGIPPQSLWGKFYPRKQRFLSNLAREEEIATKRAEAERKGQEEEEKRRAEEQERRRVEEARRKAEDERRASIQATRKSSGQCIMCGQRLNFVQKLFGKDRHGGCTSFKE